jgi:hypothetical protein
MNPGCRYGGEAFFGTATQEPSIAPNVNVSCGAMPRVPQAGLIGVLDISTCSTGAIAFGYWSIVQDLTPSHRFRA